MHTDTKFFTNQDSNSLYERFKETLDSAKYFDALVGYFRTSGFHRLYGSLNNVEKIRILVGINTDYQTYQRIAQFQQQKLNLTSQIATKARFQDEIEKEFASSDDEYNVECGVAKFRELLQAGKLEIKACLDKNIHAKVYITRYNEPISKIVFGSVVTGSSNFTENGLNANYEFNVELKDKQDVDYALERFEELWAKAVPVSEEYVSAIDERTWLNDTVTPYEIYLKFLYEYFYDEINLEAITDIDLPDNYMKLDYQINAIAKIKKITDEYNGIFISDVVGLGKTYISAMFAKILTDHKILVIAPPPIIPNWISAFKDFNIRAKNYDIESIGMLHKTIQRIEKMEKSGQKTYDYVFIDEAHRFRNGNSSQYEMLKRICLNKKVVLISATPLNNSFFDFFPLISLFQNPVNSDIPGQPNLEAFFAHRRNELKKVEKESGGKDTVEYINKIKSISKEVRDKILKYVMIRRTRTDIKKRFTKDMAKQGLFFPDVETPNRVVYEFDNHTNKIFDETIKIIGAKGTPKEERLSYARYSPRIYIKTQQLSAFETTQQLNSAGFMKSRLVKRLESSKFAFQMTIKRSIESHEKFIKMYNDGTVFISKDIDVLDYIDDDTKTIEDLLEKGKEKELEAVPTTAFRDDFIIDLKRDLELLKRMHKSWTEIQHDYKQEKFIDELAKNKLLKHDKIVVFTESAETGEDLSEKLIDIYGDKVLFYSSAKSNELKEKIKFNYDPNQNPAEQEDDISILITTDVLAEGINLHRSNVIVNYDLPWNPTRVLQRVGRVNRVGTKHSKIHIFNFFPTSETDKELGLEENIIAKIQAFHNALGEDAKYLSEVEEVESFNLRGEHLYRTLNSNEALIEDEEEDIELKYLSYLREIRDKHLSLYEKISKLPKKIRTGKADKNVSSDSLVTFFRKDKLRKFCITDGCTSREIPFDEAVLFFECTKDQERKKVPQIYYDYLQQNKNLFGEQNYDDGFSMVRKGKSKADKIVQDLRGLERCPKYTQTEKEYLHLIRCAFESRDIPDKIAKKLKDFFAQELDDIKLLAGIRKIVPDTYLNKNKKEDKTIGGSKKEVVLSEFLYAKGN